MDTQMLQKKLKWIFADSSQTSRKYQRAHGRRRPRRRQQPSFCPENPHQWHLVSNILHFTSLQCISNTISTTITSIMVVNRSDFFPDQKRDINVMWAAKSFSSFWLVRCTWGFVEIRREYHQRNIPKDMKLMGNRQVFCLFQ